MIAAFKFALPHWLIKCLNLRRDHARMKRSANNSGLEEVE